MNAPYRILCVTGAALLLPALLTGLTCEEKSDSPVVARVGSASLTLADIENSIPPQYSENLTRAQHVNFVKQWINTELLYQEALRLRVNREPDIRERMARMKRDLLSAELLSRHSSSPRDIRITDDMILRYYQENAPAFIREDNVYKFLPIVVPDLVTAWRVRNQVTRDNFLDLAANFSMAPVEDPRSAPYVAEGTLPASLSQVLSGLRAGGTTAPIAVGGDYFVVRLLDKQDRGTQATIDEVRDEIIERLSTHVQKQKIDEMLSELRMKTTVSFHLELLPEPSSDGEEDNAVSLSDSIDEAYP